MSSSRIHHSKLRPLLLGLAALALTPDYLLQAQSTPPPEETKKPAWESTFAAGLTLTRGNSETLLATLTAGTRKKWLNNELSLGADGAYGETTINGVNTKNAESIHGFVQYNRLFTERWYGYGRVEGLHDGIADIKYRATLSVGAGYYFIKNKTTDLSLEVGPGYVFQQLGDETKHYATLRVGEKFHHALSDRARIWESVEWLPEVDDFNNYIINGEIGVEADLSKDKHWTLRTYLTDTYNNVPAAGRKSNDLKLVAALAYKL